MGQLIPETSSNYEDITLTERPDGFYWTNRSDGREYGPFKSFLEAIEDIDARADEEAVGEGDVLAQAQAEIGVSDWIDEETGELAEEGIPRLDQH